MDDEDRVWLAQEARKLAAQCEIADAPLIAAAVVCLRTIVESLAEIAEQLGNINYELEARRGVHEETGEAAKPDEGLGYGGVVRSHHDGD